MSRSTKQLACADHPTTAPMLMSNATGTLVGTNIEENASISPVKETLFIAIVYTSFVYDIW